MFFRRDPVTVELAATDLSASRRFYQDLLGFVPARGGDDAILLRKRNHFIHLKRSADEGTSSSFRIPESPKQFEAIVQRLAMANVQVDLEQRQVSAWTTEWAAKTLDPDGNRVTLTTRKTRPRLALAWPGRGLPLPFPVPVIVPVCFTLTVAFGLTINVFAGSHQGGTVNSPSAKPVRQEAPTPPHDEPLVKVREIPLYFPEFDVIVYVLDDNLKWRFTKTGEFENGSLEVFRERAAEIARKRNFSDIVCVGTASIEGHMRVELARAGDRLDTMHAECNRVWTAHGKDVQIHRLNLGKFNSGPMPPLGSKGATTGDQRRAVILGIRRKKQVNDLGRQLQFRLAHYKDGAVALPFRVEQYSVFIFDGRDLTPKRIALR